MMRLVTRIFLATGCAASAVLGGVGTALANTVTIGSDLAKSSDSNTCTVPCLAVQQSQAGGSGPFSLTSPANGVVTDVGDPIVRQRHQCVPDSALGWGQ